MRVVSPAIVPQGLIRLLYEAPDAIAPGAITSCSAVMVSIELFLHWCVTPVTPGQGIRMSGRNAGAFAPCMYHNAGPVQDHPALWGKKGAIAGAYAVSDYGSMTSGPAINDV